MFRKLLLLLLCALLQPHVKGINRSPGLISANECVSREEVETIVQAATQSFENRLLVPGSFQNPALSCRDIPHNSSSGYYYIQGVGAYPPYRKYCDMSRRCCNSRGGWMRVVNLDMTDPNQQCPSGLRPVTSPRRLCGGYGNGCTSTTFPVHGVEYSRVCGRIKAYQYASTDGLYRYHAHRSTTTIDNAYVDGVSLTHGQSPRKHIWTFINTWSGYNNRGAGSCPCPYLPYRGAIPHFIGHDYFCESGSQHTGTWTTRLYTENPLWDGSGCRGSSSCCSFNGPPYFCKELSGPTTNDIELRICGDQETEDEDTQVEIIELFIQ